VSVGPFIIAPSLTATPRHAEHLCPLAFCDRELVGLKGRCHRGPARMGAPGGHAKVVALGDQTISVTLTGCGAGVNKACYSQALGGCGTRCRLWMGFACRLTCDVPDVDLLPHLGVVGFESVDSGGTYARRSATIFFATGGGEGERVSPTGVTSTFASG
jgi:hypothetical protein